MGDLKTNKAKLTPLVISKFAKTSITLFISALSMFMVTQSISVASPIIRLQILSESNRNLFQQEGKIDAKGFVNVFTFRNEILRTVHSASFNRYRASLNKTWLPILLNATENGDQVAEVILRLCETTSLLDRTNIASDCSEKNEDREFAKKRLKEIDFKPSLHNYSVTPENDFFLEITSCGDTDLCRARLSAQRLNQIISLMKTGYFDTPKVWNIWPAKQKYEFSSNHLSSINLNNHIEECERLDNLVSAINSNAKRFYTSGALQDNTKKPASKPGLTLDREIMNGNYGIAKNYELYKNSKTITMHDWSSFSDPYFTANFYIELKKILNEIENSIDQDLKRDPRWGVFLIERDTGKLFDANNIDQSNRPTDQEIIDYEGDSPRGLEKKKHAQEKKWKSMSNTELITSIYSSKINQLNFNMESAPFDIKELVSRSKISKELLDAYLADNNNAFFRFNIILVLKSKLEKNNVHADEYESITQCLVNSLDDSDSWVRAEGVKSLMFVNPNKEHHEKIKLLLHDPDKIVRDAVLKYQTQNKGGSLK